MPTSDDVDYPKGYTRPTRDKNLYTVPSPEGERLTDSEGQVVTGMIRQRKSNGANGKGKRPPVKMKADKPKLKYGN